MSLRTTIFPFACAAVVAISTTGCSSIAEKTNFITDDQIKSKVGGHLGVPPGSVTLVSRRTSGTDTYAEVQLQNKRMYSCTLNGGNALTLGIINPPQCNAK